MGLEIQTLALRLRKATAPKRPTPNSETVKGSGIVIADPVTVNCADMSTVHTPQGEPAGSDKGSLGHIQFGVPTMLPQGKLVSAKTAPVGMTQGCKTPLPAESL